VPPVAGVLAGEGARYLLASGVAFAVDFGAYSGLIRLGGVDYLVAAPIGFTLGLVVVYALSVRWVFRHRSVADARLEFTIFAAIGLAGLGLNQLVIYAGVERAALPYEAAKLVSAAIGVCFNFFCRKVLLFSRRGRPAENRGQ
jgi:putative flippase GtrA